MLEKILEALADGGAVSHGDLARSLGVDQALLRQMIEHLVTLGYLRPAVGACGGKCETCPLEGSCLGGGAEHTWALTEKGRRAAHVTGYSVD
jgi:predicted ArsR family transcriptional regulator